MPPAPEGVRIEKDVAYLAAGRKETLDLYVPTKRAAGVRSPAIVIIHGGGWTGGDKASAREYNIGTNLATAGYVAAAINYRLDENQRWPTNLFDCKNAVRFLRRFADRYQIDSEHVGVIGGSAGGHLALMVGYTSSVPSLEPSDPYPGVSNRVQAVVDMYGPTNLLTRQETDASGVPTGRLRLDSHLVPTAAESDPDEWAFASPATHVSRDSPPTLILQGMVDTTVDRDQSIALAAVLARQGVTHRLVLLPAVGHTFDLETWQGRPLPTDLRRIVVEFFDQHLKRPATR